MSQRELIKEMFVKWIPRLGLAWWDLTITYYDEPAEIVRVFRDGDDGVVAARVRANWMYAEASIDVNAPLLESMDADKIERIVVHELCHILVNEMREGELHHEERVVTGLTKAILWTVSAVEGEGTP